MAAPAKAAPLSQEDVLTATLETHPKLDGARAAIEDQEGRRLGASSVFEPQVKASVKAVPVGFYEYFQLACRVEQVLPSGGIKLEGGYRLGRGDIPDYYGERATREGGEVFAKIAVPLLAGRATDKRRAELEKSRYAIRAKKAELAETWLRIARDATVAYWSWVAAGQRLRVAEDLRAIASERATRIRAQAASGALPRIARVDTDRVLLARDSAVIKAQASFVKAQNKLSLYLRSTDTLEPRQAQLAEVPSALQASAPSWGASPDAWIDQALRSRPELRTIEAERKQALVEAKLARNQVLPKLGVSAFAARDLGPGKESLGPTDVGLGVSLTLPVFQRQGRGNQRRAKAKLRALEAKQRGLRDRIAAELREASQRAELARQRLDVAQQRLEATERLADAERTRLEEGDSDILVVNLRELDVAKAAKDAIDAAFELNEASAQILYARGQTSVEASP